MCMGVMAAAGIVTESSWRGLSTVSGLPAVPFRVCAAFTRAPGGSAGWDNAPRQDQQAPKRSSHRRAPGHAPPPHTHSRTTLKRGERG